MLPGRTRCRSRVPCGGKGKKVNQDKLAKQLQETKVEISSYEERREKIVAQEEASAESEKSTARRREKPKP